MERTFFLMLQSSFPIRFLLGRIRKPAIGVAFVVISGCTPPPNETSCIPKQKTIYSGPYYHDPKEYIFDNGDRPEIFKLSAGHFNGTTNPTEIEIEYFRPITSGAELEISIYGKGFDFIAEFPASPDARIGNAFTSATTYFYSFHTTNSESKSFDRHNRATVTIPLNYYAIPRQFSMSGTGAVQFDFTAKWAAGTTTVVVPCAE